MPIDRSERSDKTPPGAALLSDAASADCKLEKVQLEADITHLLLDLDSRNFATPEITFAPLRDGRWADFDLAGYIGKLAVDGPHLQLLVDAPENEPFGALYRAMRIRNKSLALTLVDDSIVRSQIAHMPHFGAAAEIHLHRWTWQTQAQPTLWIGDLKGRVPTFGNVSLSESGRGRFRSRNAFRLAGRFTWYLLPIEDEHTTVVLREPRGQLPEREQLLMDLLCMQFAFGTPLRLEQLVGVNSERTPVAGMSIGQPTRHSRKHRSPVPDFLTESGIWAPELFQLLSKKMHADGLLPLLIPIASYLDTQSDLLDGAYLKAQVGVEAFAKRLLGNESPERLVSDEFAWRKWIKTLKPAIRQHARDQRKADTIFGKFMSAMHAPSGGRVERALAQYGIVVPDEVLQEIAKRNYPAHGFLMNNDLEYDIDRDARRLEIVQTVLAALVAAYAGYRGPLRGYDVDADGKRSSPTWWPTAPTQDDVQTRYVGTREWTDKQ